MALLLLVSGYITFLCLVWGVILVRLLAKNMDAVSPHFSILCLFGFSAITIVAGILSLFIPLGGWIPQLIILTPALLFLLTQYWKIAWKKIQEQTTGLKTPMLLLLFVLTVLLLVMGAWKIVHPDTLGYHAQAIQWIEKYKAVPGLVHLHSRLGIQNLWFASCTLFSFNFLNTSVPTFLNTAILFWYVFFLVSNINSCLHKRENYLPGIFWILLLVMSCWSYTQIRLTATSASPDFIAALMVWAVIYIFLEQKKQTGDIVNSNWLLISFLSFVAITLKLSVLPLILLPITAGIHFIMRKKIKSLFGVIVIGIIIFTPFVARNIISSGYVAFPSTVVDISNVDWKYDKVSTILEKDYIKAYARTQADHTKESIDASLNMSLIEWVPLWWGNRSAADKAILLLFILALIVALVNIKKILAAGYHAKISLLVLLASVGFWFFQAPDPRFGFGFLIAFMAIIAYLFLKNIKINKLTILLVLSAIILTIAAYDLYRFKNFFTKEQWLMPAGIEKSSYTTTDCSGILINQPPPNKDFGNIPIPCSKDSCIHFVPRGKKISDGFRAK